MSHLEPTKASSGDSLGSGGPHGDDGSVPPFLSVPPPPPPTPKRADPVQPLSSEPPPVTGGIGSAKGVRWRGELDAIGRKSTQKSSADQPDRPSSASPPHSESDAEAAVEGDQPESADRLSRQAPPWLISLIFHLLLLVILGLITSPVRDGLGDVLLTMGDALRDDGLELSEFSIEPVEASSEEDTLDVDESPIDFDTPLEISQLVVDSPQDPVEVDFGEGPQVELAHPMFGGRSGATKAKLLKQFGGTPQTVEAVKLGLEWLKRNQSRTNGSWSMRGPYRDGTRIENRIAGTSMALLAFLGDGHTHKYGDYTQEVMKALRYLANEQDPRTGFFGRKLRDDDEKAYAQAQATIVFCEAYAMTGDSWLKPIAQAALDCCVDWQSPTGGWRYRPKHIEGDLSVTGWYVMALQSGRATPNLTVDDKAFYSLDRFMKSVSLNDGASYGYRPGYGETASMNAEGLLVRQYTGWRREHDSMRRGVQNLLDHYVFDIDQRDVYYWYYATQVLHHYGGSAWQVWNGRMREQLPAEQITRGQERGSWAPQGDMWGARGGGRLYTTCLSLYCLEVYYRHMPLYDAWNEAAEGTPRP